MSKILFLLDALEEELKEIKWWEERSPTDEALSSCVPFCADTLTFTQWLQWVYLPKMRDYVITNGKAPAKSNLYAIAEIAWAGSAQDCARLYSIIQALDVLSTST